MFTSSFNALPILLSVGAVSFLNACASQPPPLPPKKTELWSNLVTIVDHSQGEGTGQVPQHFNTVHELWTRSTEQPPLSRIEVTLAATGVLAESNGSDGQYQISVGPGECTTEWFKVEEKVALDRVKRTEQCGDQLTSQAMNRLQNAQSMMKLTCKGVSGGGVIDLHNIALSMAKAIQTPRAIEGEKAVHTYPAPVWVNLPQTRCATLTKLNQYLTRDHIRYEKRTLSDRSRAVWTRGLKAFGLPEIGLLRVAPARTDNAESRLLAIADFLLRVEGLTEGQVMTSGVSKGIFISAEKIQKHQGGLVNLPQALLDSLLIVNPEAETKDIEAQRQLSHKLTLP